MSVRWYAILLCFERISELDSRHADAYACSIPRLCQLAPMGTLDSTMEISFTVNALELTELVPLGGKLTACEAGYELSFYFPGPDLRYNGTFLKINDVLLPQYITAWEVNWRNYQFMRRNLPSSTFTSEGELGMKIDASGVGLYKLRITTDDELATMLSVFQNALARGKELQSDICNRVGRPLMPVDRKLALFAQFKAGDSLGRSTNPAVVFELATALALVRSKFRFEINSCRHHVRHWFGNAAAEEFMSDVRRHGLDVFCEQADFIITWRGRS
ncbi:hypothetical protein [Janthinobacterium sp. SUN120]|uniref:hypothetical protein n=1 Tax=Janthinobacterium sp. SUN120 TaxID=3004099 RepID=UPI0025AF0AA5|nr:hypothetical protein [Janthinobacterium sp. SUN120]MDN2713692.1 hypothetical protein [Janthinobacterium sp. SUN120]